MKSINWSTPIFFAGISHPVGKLLTTACSQQGTIDPIIRFTSNVLFVEKRADLTEIQAPQGFVVKQLRPEHLDLVLENWAFKGNNSKARLRPMGSGLAFGVFEGENPVSWIGVNR